LIDTACRSTPGDEELLRAKTLSVAWVTVPVIPWSWKRRYARETGEPSATSLVEVP